MTIFNRKTVPVVGTVPLVHDAVDLQGKVEDLKVDWTPAEERRARLKVDLTVMPLLFLAFFALQIDRGNLGSALTDPAFFSNTHTTIDQANVGTQLVSAGIVLLEIPSNILLQKIGAQRWLSFQIVAFGLVATFQLFVGAPWSFFLTRFLLGLMESGYIPGGLYFISTWYKRDEVALRIAFYFWGNMTAQAASGLLAYGILQLGGRNGIAGWQYLFLIEGTMSIFIGLLFLMFLPASPLRGHPILFKKLQYFSEREAYILHKRILVDDPNKARGAISISRSDLKKALLDWRIYPHLLITLTALEPATAMQLYAPTIIGTLGFDKLRANALSSVGPWISLVLVVCFARLSDWSNRRSIAVIAALTYYLTFFAALYGLPVTTGSWTKYAILTLTLSGNSLFHSINGAWLSVNCQSPQMRSLAMAMWIMSANMSGIAGAQLFRADDAPLYRRGFMVCVILICIGWATAVLQGIQYYISRMRQIRKLYDAGAESPVSEQSDESLRKPFLYTW